MAAVYTREARAALIRAKRAAKALKVKVKVKEVQMGETATEAPPLMISQHGTGAMRVVVVGAGGTGGRLIGPLMQVLRQGDQVAVVDGDHVEDRNLARQNFRARDIGENKAEVMVRRYQREGIEATAFGAMLTESNWSEVVRTDRPARVVILGCVDNTAARGLMKLISRNLSCIWIDGGNEMRGGQVILSAYQWPFMLKGIHPPTGQALERAGNYNLDGFKAMPQLLVPRPEEATEASCRDRIDLQTVAVNNLSATAMLNALSCVLYGVPMTTCGAFFSTLNTMSPIRLKGVRWEHGEIEPETTYAAVEG